MLVALVVASSAVYARSFAVPGVFDDRAASSSTCASAAPGPFLSARPLVDLTLAPLLPSVARRRRLPLLNLALRLWALLLDRARRSAHAHRPAAKRR
jgi:hypothetical protein